MDVLCAVALDVVVVDGVGMFSPPWPGVRCEPKLGGGVSGRPWPSTSLLSMSGSD